LIMNNGGNDSQRVSRRVALSGAALALGAAAIATAVSQAAAQQKIGQADAKYQATPKGDLHCDGCVAEGVQISSRRHQSERLVSAVYPEELVLAVPGIFRAGRSPRASAANFSRSDLQPLLGADRVRNAR
jgi:hypothetical protein